MSWVRVQTCLSSEIMMIILCFCCFYLIPYLLSLGCCGCFFLITEHVTKTSEFKHYKGNFSTMYFNHKISWWIIRLLKLRMKTSPCWNKEEANFYLPLLAVLPCKVDCAERIHRCDGGVVAWPFQRTFYLLAPGSLASMKALISGVWLYQYSGNYSCHWKQGNKNITNYYISNPT